MKRIAAIVAVAGTVGLCTPLQANAGTSQSFLDQLLAALGLNIVPGQDTSSIIPGVDPGSLIPGVDPSLRSKPAKVKPAKSPKSADSRGIAAGGATGV